MVLLVLIRLIASTIARREVVQRAEVVSAELALVRSEDEPDDVPAVPADDLMTHADRAADRGDFSTAVLMARAASLRGLGDAGRLALHRSRTDREYARALADEPELGGALELVLTEAERARWAAREPTETDARGAIAAARRILGLLGLLCLVVLPSAAEASRYAPFGDAAIVGVFAAYGYDATWRRAGLGELGDEVDVLVLDLDAVAMDDGSWAAVHAWVSSGGFLIVAGDEAMEVFGLEAAEPVPSATPIELVESAAAAGATLPRWPDGPVAGWAGADAWVVSSSLVDPLAPVVVIDVDGGSVVAIADSRLFTNALLASRWNRDFLGGIVDAVTDVYGGPSLAGARVEVATRAAAPQTPAASVANARMAPFVLQLPGPRGAAGARPRRSPGPVA